MWCLVELLLIERWERGRGLVGSSGQQHAGSRLPETQERPQLMLAGLSSASSLWPSFTFLSNLRFVRVLHPIPRCEQRYSVWMECWCRAARVPLSVRERLPQLIFARLAVPLHLDIHHCCHLRMHIAEFSTVCGGPWLLGDSAVVGSDVF